MLQAVIFDLDGTLTTSDDIHFQVWKEVLADYAIDLDEDLYRQRISGRQNPAIVADLLPQLSPAEGEQLGHDKEAAFRQLAANQLQPLPGVLELIQWIQGQDLKTAVVTNAPPDNARFMLQALGFSQTFDRVIIADDLPRGKPDPLPYQEALRQLAIAADQAVAFEDSPAGIRSALGAGLLTVGIASTHAIADLEALGVKFAIADFTDSRLRQLGLRA